MTSYALSHSVTLNSAQPIEIINTNGYDHWLNQRQDWLSTPLVVSLPPSLPLAYTLVQINPSEYSQIYDKLIRKSITPALNKRLSLVDAFSVIVHGWKEDGVLPHTYLSAPLSPLLFPAPVSPVIS